MSRLSRGRGLMIGVALAAAALLGRSAGASVLVNDTWLDGTDSDPAAPVWSENGVDSDADGNLESAWFQGGVGTLDPVGAGGPERGNLTTGGTSSASWTTYATPETGKVTLGQGESLHITWAFTPSNVNTSNTSQNFRLTLVNTPNGSRLSANGTPASAAFTGYAMFMNMGQTLGNSNPFRLMRRNVSSGDLLNTSGNWVAVGTTGATSGNHGYDSGTLYTFDMTLTHNALDGLDINATMTGGTLDNDGTAQVLFTDAAPQGGSFTFDTFDVRPSGATTTAELFDTSLFKVEYIP